MRNLEKKTNEATNLSQQLGDEGSHSYPDFEAMWMRIEAARSEQDEQGTSATPLQTKPLFRGRRLAVLSLAAFVLLATPVLAYITMKWDFKNLKGVESAIQHGFGQPINKKVTNSGVTFAIDTAVSDDNGTTLLYSLNTGDKQERKWIFDQFDFKDEKGNSIESLDYVKRVNLNYHWRDGYYWDKWDEESRTYNGFFETSWTVPGNEANVQLSARGLQAYDYVRVPIDLDPHKAEVQTFPVHDGGIEELKVQFVKGGQGQALLKYSVSYTDNSNFNIVGPQIVVKKEGKVVNRSGDKSTRTIEIDGHPEWGVQEGYSSDELLQGGNSFEFVYGVKGSHIEGEWNIGMFTLNKEKAMKASVTRELNIPLHTSQGDSILRKLIIRPTAIKLEVENKKVFHGIPYRSVSLLVNGRKLEGWELTLEYFDTPLYGYRQVFEFPVRPDLRLTADMPVELLLEREIEKINDYKKPIKLTAITDEKKETLVNVEGYPVKVTYYTKNGDLYVENESENLKFSGVSQTYMKQGDERIFGKVLFFQWEENWLDWENSNKYVNVYRGFKGNETEIYLFEFYIRHWDRNLKIKLQ
ncbi:DUF4179 domain-containing protein [Paenibacillus alvei]|uniref:DUF4179 domain-containing protein n=1 Tax=Paenibacillus alvei TaxID=44250 RepID=UPI00227FD800|nr:DUF4179 domain-containing protein [Paenibacillus alvei]MCY9702756.1 DUF4179 domain-containing protein [Paenibacillus alvei]MCY9734205.1 DUF4179 domain-containing protein [Paenibacillus alvei]